MRSRPAAPAAASLALLALLTACSTGPGVVEASTLEEKVSEGVTPDEEGTELEIDCPEDLEAEVDATATCTVDDGESRTGIRFTTTEVEDDEVRWETTPFLERDVLEETLTLQLADQGIEVDGLDCPEDLDGVTGETTRCTATAGGEEGEVELEVNRVDGLRIGFSWKVV
ncbi:DUF4333 domain-containing protein [Nocardioides solisilvae]|uniref:DUF4333 domain-containing protein n=1 Tax=Nocardioides solisilvae TaxID=1542435 RepID=UPI000D741287|nr:DUF4333 domain-containing protein [Nocardioides solisilvae]